MKKLYAIAASLMLVPLSLYAQDQTEADGSELATFSISFEIEGSRLPGLPPGTGDRRLGFDMLFPADSGETANELFYSHIRILLGDDEQNELRDFARKFEQQR